MAAAPVAERLGAIESEVKRVCDLLLTPTPEALGSCQPALERAVSELLANFDGLKDDFAVFFPALQSHVGESPDA